MDLLAKESLTIIYKIQITEKKFKTNIKFKVKALIKDFKPAYQKMVIEDKAKKAAETYSISEKDTKVTSFEAKVEDLPPAFTNAS